MTTIAAIAPPALHLRPRKISSDVAQRDSNALRASVLETALELGFGSNTTVANWIFNNPLQEEDEPEEEETPVQASTYVSTSEGVQSTQLLFNNGAGAHTPVPMVPNGSNRLLAIDTSLSPFDSPMSTSKIPYQPSFMTSDPFDGASARGVLHAGPVQHKLKKTRRVGTGTDGYESEGWTSDNSRKSKKELRKEKSRRKKKDQEDKAQERKEAKRDKKDKGSSLPELDAGYLSEPAPKSFKRPTSRVPSSEPPNIKPTTPVAKKVRSTSSRSLTPPSPPTSPRKPVKSLSFFRLSSRSSRERLDKVDREQPEPVPPLPSRPLPIAERFATANSMRDSALAMMSATPSIRSAASTNSHGDHETDRRSFDSGMGMSTSVPHPWMKGSHSDPGDNASMQSSLSVSTATTRTGAGYHSHGSPNSDGLTTPVPSVRTVSPAPSENPYVVPTPTGSTNNIPGTIFTPPGSRNPLQKVMKLMPTPLSASPNPSQLHPSYSISHPNTHTISRTNTPSPLSSTSSHNFVFPPTPSLTPAPITAPTPTHNNTLQPPSPVIRRRSLLIVTPPSPSGSKPIDDDDLPDPSRAILAYYEIPPPSPPPTGPLPLTPHAQHLLPQPPIQRGRVSPFPTSPVSPSNMRSADRVDGVGGLEGRVKVKRNRDLHSRDGGGVSDENGSSSGSHERYEDEDNFHSTPRRKDFIAKYPGVKDRPPSDYYEEDSAVLESVLSQFSDGGLDHSSASDDEEDETDDQLLYRPMEVSPPRSRAPYSHPRLPSPPYALGYDLRTSNYTTTSLYSAHSIMDNEKSGQTRDQFVKRVQAMYGPDGRERRSSASLDRERESLEMEKSHMKRIEERGRGRPNAIPPVPQLPEEFRALHKLKEQNQRRRF